MPTLICMCAHIKSKHFFESTSIMHAICSMLSWLMLQIFHVCPLEENWVLVTNQFVITCRNPSLGLTIKTRACKGAGQEGSSRTTSHVPGSIGKCEGMNPHTLKWAPILGVGLLIFQRVITKVKTHWIEKFLIPFKILET